MNYLQQVLDILVMSEHVRTEPFADVFRGLQARLSETEETTDLHTMVDDTATTPLVAHVLGRLDINLLSNIGNYDQWDLILGTGKLGPELEELE